MENNEQKLSETLDNLNKGAINLVINNLQLSTNYALSRATKRNGEVVLSVEDYEAIKDCLSTSVDSLRSLNK